MGLSSSALRDANVDPRLLPEDSELILRGSTCDDAIAIDECANPTDRLRESVRVKLLSAPFTTKWPAALFERIVSKCVGVLDGFDNIDEPMLDKDVQDELLAQTSLLETYGPQLGRPWADTLNGSRHANMKELRFKGTDGVWRVAFAFDARRHAILLVAGDKSGGGEKRFYRELIRKADVRLDAHLDRLKKTKGR